MHYMYIIDNIFRVQYGRLFLLFVVHWIVI